VFAKVVLTHNHYIKHGTVAVIWHIVIIEECSLAAGECKTSSKICVSFLLWQAAWFLRMITTCVW